MARYPARFVGSMAAVSVQVSRMSEIQALLEGQARWQRTRRDLSWPEKIHMAESVRESVLQLRKPQKGEPAAERGL